MIEREFEIEDGGNEYVAYYICGKSKNKIVHRPDCRYMKIIPTRNRKEFATFNEAEQEGYIQCKYCAGIIRLLRAEAKNIRKYCVLNGIIYDFNTKDGALDLISHSGKWKIVLERYPDVIGLYHQNNNVIKKNGFVPGFHKQKARCDSLLGYMEYIVSHDAYRTKNPIYEQARKKMGRGRKAQRKIKRREVELRRIHNFVYVNNILDKIEADSMP